MMDFSDLPSLRLFGWLSAFAMIATLFADLFILRPTDTVQRSAVVVASRATFERPWLSGAIFAKATRLSHQCFKGEGLAVSFVHFH